MARYVVMRGYARAAIAVEVAGPAGDTLVPDDIVGNRIVHMRPVLGTNGCADAAGSDRPHLMVRGRDRTCQGRRLVAGRHDAVAPRTRAVK